MLRPGLKNSKIARPVGWFALFFSLLLVASPKVMFGKTHQERGPNVASASAIVVSVPIGQVMFEKSADDVRPVASLSKLMSAIVFMERCNHLGLESLHKMTSENRLLAKGGDRSKLTTNWSYTHLDLLKAALMRSDNRALPALMASCGMRLQEFAMHMNLKAKELGLKKTSFSEPNGLSQYNVSTAREYVKVTLEASRFPILNQIMQTKRDVITAWRDGKARSIELGNTDILIGRKGVDVIAGKTGYTDIARYCFSILNRLVDSSTVAMVFLGAEGKHTRFGDFSRVHRWLSERLSNRFTGEGDTPSQGS